MSTSNKEISQYISYLVADELPTWKLVGFTKQSFWSMNCSEGRNYMILDAGYLTLDAYDPNRNHKPT